MSEDFSVDFITCFRYNYLYLSHFQKTLEKVKNFLHKLGICPSFLFPQKKYCGLMRRKKKKQDNGVKR